MMSEVVNSEFQKHYTDDGFWDKLRGVARAAGAKLVEKALTLYYCARDPDTPGRARAIILGALGYFILPLDAIPDVIPVIGYSDDLGVILAALAVVVAHIKPVHSEQARAKMRAWFGG